MPAGIPPIQRHLAALKALRGDRRGQPPRLKDLKAWQARRFATTYGDLLQEPRYEAATRFFLEDLYGPKDFSARDDAMIRILPTLSKLLSRSAVETAAFAVELEALTEDLDQRLARALPAGPIEPGAYARAYRETSTREERRHQLDLALAVGHRLDSLVKKPLVLQTLKLMRAPASLAGLSDLQDFLERGFQSFRAMRGAGLFLATIEERETEILRRLFSGSPLPFA